MEAWMVRVGEGCAVALGVADTLAISVPTLLREALTVAELEREERKEGDREVDPVADTVTVVLFPVVDTVAVGVTDRVTLGPLDVLGDGVSV